jgi:hypothetical protein
VFPKIEKRPFLADFFIKYKHIAWSDKRCKRCKEIQRCQVDFGLEDFGVLETAESLKRYRRYVYEVGAVDQSEKLVAPVPSSGATGQAAVIDNSVLQKERENDFKLKRLQRFRYRTRYFTDSGIIGTKEFVAGNYRRFKDLFMSKKDKIHRPVAGLDGIFSLKRLADS